MSTLVTLSLFLTSTFGIFFSDYQANGLDSFAFAQLKGTVDGVVTTERNTDTICYDAARQPFDPLYESFMPKIIVECQSSNDVEIALTFALFNGVDFKIRSGRHSALGYSTCVADCLIIDLGQMTQVSVDMSGAKSPVNGKPTVSFGPGWRSFQINRYLETFDPANKFFISTGLQNVGVGGNIGGGGWGAGVRQVGIASDSIVEMKIVVINYDFWSWWWNPTRVETVSKYDTDPEKQRLFRCSLAVIQPTCGIIVEFTSEMHTQNAAGYVATRTNYIFGPNANPFNPIPDAAGVQAAIAAWPAAFDILTVEEAFSNRVFYHSITTFAGGLIGQSNIYINFSSEAEVLAQEALFRTRMANETGGVAILLPIPALGYYVSGLTYTQAVCVADYPITVPDSSILTGDPGTDCTNPAVLADFTTTRRPIQGTGWFYETKAEWDSFITNPLKNGIVANRVLNECPFQTGATCLFYISTWGGALADNQALDNGFPWRNAKLDFIWTSIDDFDPNLTWLRGAISDSLNFSLTTGRVYANYLAANFENKPSLYMPAVYGNRETQVRDDKCEFDPLNKFTIPQGVPTDTCSYASWINNIFTAKQPDTNSIVNEPASDGITNGAFTFQVSYHVLFGVLMLCVAFNIVLVIVIRSSKKKGKKVGYNRISTQSSGTEESDVTDADIQSLNNL